MNGNGGISYLGSEIWEGGSGPGVMYMTEDLYSPFKPDPYYYTPGATHYGINFYARLGKRVFPEFEREIHVKDVLFRDSAPLYLGWDFGWHHPAVVFAIFINVDIRSRWVYIPFKSHFT